MRAGRKRRGRPAERGDASIPPANPIGPTVAGARLVHPPAAAGQSATPTGADSPSHPKEGLSDRSTSRVLFWCFDGTSMVTMTSSDGIPRVASTSRDIAAGLEPIFQLIADPSQQPRWDGNDNLAEAPAGQRVRRVGDVFTMTLTSGGVRENHVVEFVEGRRIAWQPAEPEQEPPGHLWRWELDPIDGSHTRVTHTYDWSQLTDKNRFARARDTTPDRLRPSIDRLAALVEGS